MTLGKYLLQLHKMRTGEFEYRSGQGAKPDFANPTTPCLLFAGVKKNRKATTQSLPTTVTPLVYLSHTRRA